MLKAAELHDHFCPGLNAGFIIKAKLDKDLPLGAGDRYVFVGAPPICAMDVLQSVYGATMGKKGAFSMMVPKAAKQAARDGVPPFLIVMRVNAKKDVCDGMVLALDWDKLGAAIGIDKKELSPKGGGSNPLFYIVRTKMSFKLVQNGHEGQAGLHRGPGTVHRPGQADGPGHQRGCGSLRRVAEVVQ